MDVDWITVIVSTALSAVVGTVVSLAAIAQTTTRQRRAERRDDARQRIKQLVARRLAQVTTYRAGVNNAIQKGEEDHNRMRGEDYTLASHVLTVASELSPVRRWFVKRRCKRLFGPFTAQLAALYPTPSDSPGNILAPLMVATQADSELGRMDPRSRFGTLHHALFENHDSPNVRRLERDLRRLSASW